MHVHFLDPYRPRPSLIHRLDARVKFVVALAFILTAALLPPGALPAYILLFTLLLAVEILSELGVGYVLRRAALALPFILAALPLLFTQSGLPLFSFQVFGLDLTVTAAGLERFLGVAVKSWLSVQAAIVLTASTPFPDLLVAMRAVRIPRLLVAIFGLMWRYLFVLVDEALRLLRARAARSGLSELPGLKPGGSLAWRGRMAGGMAGSLFLRAFDRSDRIYNAMLARGYDGEVRSLPLPGLGRQSRLVLTLSLAVLALILLTGLVFA
jgi:cobalt/nickel transport system permease protein